MIAVFKTGGKQYCVKPGQILKVEKIEGKKGDNLSFKNILVLSDGVDNIVGNPLIKGASIEAKILDQIRDKKIIVFKKRRRKNSRSTSGHRQYLTVLKIENILNESKATSKSSSSKQVKTNIQKNNIGLSENKKEISVEKSVVKKTTSKKITKKRITKKKLVTKKIIKSKK